jgi:sodium transport system ATP-binding protein
MIVIKDIAKSFGDVKAVRGVSFNAEDGKITTLLGANGSGKTTTFRSVTGLMKPDGGAVHIDTINVRERTLEAQARLGVFPDQFGLYTRLTTREHIAYYAELHGLEGSALNDAINEVSKLMNLEDIIDRKTEGFSQGQRMKVALARAIVHKPQNIILDEPTRGLDVMNIRLLRDILLELKEQGHCILLSSHVMAEVDALSDHIVIMSDGLICADGTSASLMAESGEENLEEAFVNLTEQARRNAA